MEQENQIKPFVLEEMPRKEHNRIDKEGILYKQMKVTMEAMQPNRKIGFVVPKNGDKISKLKKYVEVINHDINLLMPEELRKQNPRIYTAIVIKNEAKEEIGIRVFRDK